MPHCRGPCIGELPYADWGVLCMQHGRGGTNLESSVGLCAILPLRGAALLPANPFSSDLPMPAKRCARHVMSEALTNFTQPPGSCVRSSLRAWFTAWADAKVVKAGADRIICCMDVV